MPRSLIVSTLLALIVAPAFAPRIPAASAASATTADKPDKADKVNINTASAKDLQKLDGVGRTVAERIVHYRDEHGPFKRGEDLRKVDGVGATLWERNRERIVVK